MTLELPREDWGDRVHRAYRLGRDQYGYTYKEIAKAITKAGWPISEQTLFRIERNPQVSKLARHHRNEGVCDPKVVFRSYHVDSPSTGKA